jgi:oligopeptidase B
VTDAPRAKQVAHQWTRPTGVVDDPWAWLIDRDDPDTTAYLEAENAYSAAWFAGHQATVDEVFAEIKSRVQETDLSAPVAHGGWWYVTRSEEGASYPTYCRGRTADTATERVILDINVEAAGHEFFDVGVTEISHDHHLFAYSVDTDGGERYVTRIRDLRTNDDLPDRLTNTSWAGLAWAADNETLFYVTSDEQMRPHRVWRHLLGTEQADDVLVFDELDERFFVGVETSRSGEWVIISTSSKLSSEALVIPATNPTVDPVVVSPRRADVEYSVDHWGEVFVVLTNLDALDFRVMTAPIADPAAWTDLVAHQPGRRVMSVDTFEGHLVLHEWAGGQPRLRVLFADGTERPVELGSEPHDVEVDANPEWRTTEIRYRYQSFTTPPSVYAEHVRTGARELLKRTPTPNTDLGRYRAERLWATADDGAMVPVDVVHLADAQPDGTAPCVVYAYGSYEASMPPWFSAARLSLLDRGVVWALAHPRGGGEMGRGWYYDGRLLHKRNTFTDVIACAEHLADHGWTRRGRLAVRGGSAGGLMVGACVTMRPELWAAAVAEVPFVDVVSTMSDPSIPLTITEWDEWGDPRTEPFASYMLSYSPYDNTNPGEYPALYITAGLNDPRVSYHEPAKWIAKLRAVRTNDAPLIMRCEMGAGHGGPTGRYDAWLDEARILTFLLATLGDRVSPASE